MPAYHDCSMSAYDPFLESARTHAAGDVLSAISKASPSDEYSFRLKMRLLCALRDICDELFRYDALDLLKIYSVHPLESGVRLSYGFSGSCCTDDENARMRLAAIPDDVFENIASIVSMLECCISPADE